jgi:hypothetical protein
MVAELLLAVTLSDQTPAQHWASYGARAAQIGLAAQIIFAILPLVQLCISTDDANRRT